MTFPDGYTTVVPMRRTLHLLAILTAAASVFLSCSGKVAKQTGLTDSDLFSRGQQRMAKKSYNKAIEHFQVLLERFPTSPLAPRAQLALADAHMENKDNVEAEVGYDDFLRLYPANDNVPYALFRKGELLFRQMSKPGRDQTKTIEAIRIYRLFLGKSPSGPHAVTAAKRVAELRNRLADNEVVVVSHYITRRKYDSAEARARRAVADYPDTTSLPSLMSLLAQALDREGKKEEAAEVRKSLREKFPGRGDKK
ncbi:MAG: outer membrane protein assembly factor BamD [Deltaproteobacteria bacterium]|nr:outer membrane protein assembly factor BamD [Deltaproteobacteria bacterium]